jgi:hypothetical protein
MLVLGDDITRCWKQIIYHGGRGATPARTPVSLADDAGEGDDADDALHVTQWAGLDVVRDEAGGVRLLRPTEDD